MKRTKEYTLLEQELMLQVNERLFQLGLLTKELYEEAKTHIISGRS